MQLSTLNARVEEFNNDFADFELNKKFMIMKASTLKEECAATIREIEEKQRKLASEKESAQSRLTEIEAYLNKL